MKQAQITMFMLLGILILVGVVFWAILSLPKIQKPTKLEEKIAAEDVRSYVKTCIERTFSCSIYEMGANYEFETLKKLSERSADYTVRTLTTCLGNLSEVFAGAKTTLLKPLPRTEFAETDTVLLTDSPAKTEVDGLTADIGKISSRINVAFSKAAGFAQSLTIKTQQGAVLEEPNQRYIVRRFQLENQTAYHVTDFNSTLQGKEYSIVFIK